MAFVRHDPGFFSLLLLYAIAALCGIAWAIRGFPTQRPTGKTALAILGCSAVLFICGVLPYALVGKFPQINSYNDRHAILALLPVAAGIVMMLRYAVRSDRAFRIAGMTLLVFCCVLQSRNYVLWQNRFVKYLATIENLKGQDAKVQSVVVFDDRADIGRHEILRSYEADWMLKRAFGNERHIGFDAALIDRATYARAQRDWDREYYMFSEATFGSSATKIAVVQNSSLSEPQIFFKYYLGGAEQRNAFLKSLVRLEFRDTPTESWLVK